MKVTKRQLIILVVSSILTISIILLLALNYFYVFFVNKDIVGVDGALIKPVEDSLNVGLYDNTISDQDELFAKENAPHRVTIVNLDVLARTDIKDYAVESLESYLDRYFNYYLKNDTKYEGMIVENSYKDNPNFPSFKVYVNELDIEIDCLYILAKDRYRFDSILSSTTE